MWVAGAGCYEKSRAIRQAKTSGGKAAGFASLYKYMQDLTPMTACSTGTQAHTCEGGLCARYCGSGGYRHGGRDGGRHLHLALCDGISILHRQVAAGKSETLQVAHPI